MAAGCKLGGCRVLVQFLPGNTSHKHKEEIEVGNMYR